MLVQLICKMPCLRSQSRLSMYPSVCQQTQHCIAGAALELLHMHEAAAVACAAVQLPVKSMPCPGHSSEAHMSSIFSASSSS